MQVMTDPIEANRALIERFVDGHDSRPLRADATFTDVTSGQSWTGPEAIGGMFMWLYSVAFEAHAETRRIIATADAAVFEGDFVGIHRGEFAGVPGTGREVRVPLVVIYDLEAGAITGARVHFSVASFLTQATALAA